MFVPTADRANGKKYVAWELGLLKGGWSGIPGTKSNSVFGVAQSHEWSDVSVGEKEGVQDVKEITTG